jgi:hypothetical protein
VLITGFARLIVGRQVETRAVQPASKPGNASSLGIRFNQYGLDLEQARLLGGDEREVSGRT